MIGEEKDAKLKMWIFLVFPKVHFYSYFLKGLEI